MIKKIILIICAGTIILLFALSSNTPKKRSTYIIRGGFALPSSSDVVLTAEYHYIRPLERTPLTEWKRLKEAVLKAGQFEITFDIPEKTGDSEKYSTYLIRLSYTIPGYIPQYKIFDSYRNTLDIGMHSPVLDTLENKETYKKLIPLCSAQTMADAVETFKNISVSSDNPFFPTVASAQAVLAFRNGDIAYILHLKKQNLSMEDRFWPCYTEYVSESPFSLPPSSFIDLIGPFEPKEYTLSQIIAAGLDRTRLPLNELNKMFFIPGYHANVSAQDISKIFDLFPITGDIKKNCAKYLAPETSDAFEDMDYSHKIKTAMKTVSSLGPRKLGDLQSRQTFYELLVPSIPPGFSLKRDRFRYQHSFHGDIELENFYVEPEYAFSSSVLLCTHYDSFSGNVDDPGANNGLSGVLVFLQTLSDTMFLDFCKKNKLGLFIHFYDGETAGEPGNRSEYFLGSKHFGNSGKSSPTAFQYVLCLDMVGVSFSYDTIGNSTDPELMEHVLKIAKSMGASIGPLRHIEDDHSIYHHTLKIPAVLLIQYEYAHYHTSGDSLDKLNPYVILNGCALVRNVILSKLNEED